MIGALHQLYFRLPYPLRSVIASARGYQLRGWRYDAGSERKVRNFLDRDVWPASRWKRWQEDQSAMMLHHAATRVPYYRALWQERRKKGDKASWEVLANWPVLERAQIHENPRAFLAEGYRPGSMIHEVTSGTTGQPVELWLCRKTVKDWYALFEARNRRWYGVSRRDRWGLLAGQMVAPPAARKPPFWVWNKGLNQLYLSCHHAAPAYAEDYFRAMREHEIRYLVAYPSSLYAIARGAQRKGWKVPSLELIITQSEQLYDFQRRAIESVFRCEVRDSYGMSEICAAASECRHGSMHIWPEAGVIEVVENGRAVKPGETGDFLCTGLMNPGMPLIRYRVGDRGALAPADTHCDCGRHLPVMRRLEGRISDTLVTEDGRCLSPNALEAIFDRKYPIQEGQLIQESTARVRLRYVPEAGFSEDTARLLEEAIRERLGHAQVIFEAVDRIPRLPNGKVRAVVSLVRQQWAHGTQTA